MEIGFDGCPVGPLAGRRREGIKPCFVIIQILFRRFPYAFCFSLTVKPIFFLGFSSISSNCLIASNTILKFSSYFFSMDSIFFFNSSCVDSICRSLVNALMISILTPMALSLLSTLDSMATPCSVNAKGKYFECCPLFKVTICDLKGFSSVK